MAIALSMRAVAFTIDVDRDVNLPANGRKQAISKCHDGNLEGARFDSSLRGLVHLCSLIEDLGIRATFFFEGDTLIEISKSLDVRDLLSGHEVACHGMCHEDITGESTGLPLSDAEVEQMLDDSRDILWKAFAREPVGFRAPYQHIDGRTLQLLRKKGFLYDSSMTCAIAGEGGILPWKTPESLWELPLAQGKDERGRRIVSYLWPMHEGKRPPQDYVRLAGGVRSGALILATHSWHLGETYGKGLLSEDELRSNLRNVRMVLEGIMAKGMEFSTLYDLVTKMEGWNAPR